MYCASRSGQHKMPCGKYKHSSSKWSNFPRVLPKPHSQQTVLLRGREQHLVPLSNYSVPGEDQEGTAQLLPVLLSCHGKNSCLNASFVKDSVSCLCSAASHQALSTQLGSCFYKVWAVTNSDTSKYNCTSLSTALPVGQSPYPPSILQQTSARSHPKRPLIPELSTAGIRAS